MMSYLLKEKSKNTTIHPGGIRRISGVNFLNNGHGWVADLGEINLVLNSHPGHKCALVDTRDGSEFTFKTVAGAYAFAKRRRHGRSLEEHERAEKLQYARESTGMSVKAFSGLINISPRTFEAYSSGARAVPISLVSSVSKTIFSGRKKP